MALFLLYIYLLWHLLGTNNRVFRMNVSHVSCFLVKLFIDLTVTIVANHHTPLTSPTFIHGNTLARVLHLHRHLGLRDVIIQTSN